MMYPVSRPKPAWRVFLESVGGAALLTALVGGLVAQYITASIQRHAAKREFNNAWVKARGDQALTAYKEFSTEQLHLVEQVYTIVGRLDAACEALVAGANWDRSKDTTDAYVRKIAMEFNDAEDEWVKAKPRFTMLLSYYSDPGSGVDMRWASLRKSVDAYRECVSSWYDSDQGHYPAEAICAQQKNSVDEELNSLGTALAKTRTYVWRGWDSPSALRKELHIPDTD
jgi:hypothetical protein